MRTMMASAFGRWICSRASEWATTAMSAATPHSIALSAWVAACAVPATAPEARSAATTGFKVRLSKKEKSARLPGRFGSSSYCALPLPLVDGLVAVSLEGAVRGEASPGPAVVPVLPGAAGAPAAPAGALVAPPLAAPERYASHSEREIMPSPFLSMAEKSPVPRAPRLALRSPAGAFGSPAERGLAAPPVGPVPVLLAPEGGAPASPPPEELWARIRLSPAADTCAAKGRANAPATATTSNFLKFIQSPGWKWNESRLAWPVCVSPQSTCRRACSGRIYVTSRRGY